MGYPIVLPNGEVTWYYSINAFHTDCPSCDGIIPANEKSWNWQQYTAQPIGFVNGVASNVVHGRGPYCAACFYGAKRQFDRIM
ncbi:uncharacterized protein APUU_50411S [Aspergillus puulaauensis]|uniref:Uncharacterized protein n=1 Tax=Aspergillus puulaauensis TaxID=1220207 RepID=A0A7R7XQC1_9EURO|nr:uncharacterized protein APUU_50411S [Aspergillus puulaauensis]BCS25700.1 hypothetical protein APUU_50411S [Aspergillus puulaauensis]